MCFYEKRVRKLATTKQKDFIRSLLRRAGDFKPSNYVEALSRREASRLIGELLDKPAIAPRKFGAVLQANLPLPPPEEPAGELGEFKRWARGVFQRGEKTILELIDLQTQRFGNPFAL